MKDKNFKMIVNIVVCLVIFIFAIGCQSIPKAQEQKNKETEQIDISSLEFLHLHQRAEK